jgi:hypothetical protein
MPGFTDAERRAWVIDLNVGAIKQVRAQCNVDLLDVGGEVFQRLAGDPILLCDVLFVLCQEAAEQNNVSSESFGKGLAGNAIDEAVEALLEGLVAFFPNSRRHLAEKALAKSRALEQKIIEHMETVIESDKFDQAVEEGLREIDNEVEFRLASIGIGSGNTPESSE